MADFRSRAPRCRSFRPAAAGSSRPGNPAAKDPVALDALQVTAQRRVENAKDVPVALSAIQGEKLDVLGSAAMTSVSWPHACPASTSSRPTAVPSRASTSGLGNTDFDLNASQPVSLVYDDVVQESPLLKGFPLFDLANVEVLRGPQGTLFGRNTPAGVVKFDSARPSQDADGYIRVGYGSYNSWNVQGAYGGPLTDRWSARVSAIYQRRDDWVDNTRVGAPNSGFEGYDEAAGRVQFLYEGDDFEALFNLHKRKLMAPPACSAPTSSRRVATRWSRTSTATGGQRRRQLLRPEDLGRQRAPAVEPRLGDAALDHRLRNRRIAQPR